MKLKYSFVGVVVVCCVIMGLGLSGFVSPSSGAPAIEKQSLVDDAKAPKPPKKGKKKKTDKPLSFCPKGWEKVSGGYDLDHAFKCKPKAPKYPYKHKRLCPEGTVWFFDGCHCGCKPISN